MAGVGGKLPHALFGMLAVFDRRRDAGDRVVERCGEVRDLVDACHEKTTRREIAVGQRAQRLAHLVHRPKRLLGKEAADEP